jgi:hypothetical protein
MLSAAICLFMCLNELRVCLLSIAPFVKYIFCIDGRFIGFNYPSKLSVDGSRELIKGFDNAMLIDAPDLKEINKRQIYLNMTKEHDIDLLLVLDSDEYIELDPGMTWTKFEEFCRFEYENNNKITTQFGIKVENANTPGLNQFDFRPRIFANPYDIKHVDHRTFVTKSENKPVGISCNIAGVRLRHNYSQRYETYNELKLQYQKQLTESERY